jgi:hypothetical protein
MNDAATQNSLVTDAYTETITNLIKLCNYTYLFIYLFYFYKHLTKRNRHRASEKLITKIMLNVGSVLRNGPYIHDGGI